MVLSYPGWILPLDGYPAIQRLKCNKVKAAEYRVVDIRYHGVLLELFLPDDGGWLVNRLYPQ